MRKKRLLAILATGERSRGELASELGISSQPWLSEVSALIKGPQITWTFPSVSFSKDCDDTNPSWVVTLGGVSGDIGVTMSIGMGPGITVGYWSRYTLQVDVEFADNSLAVVRHGWISGGVLNVDFGVVNLDGEFARFDFTKELK